MKVLKFEVAGDDCMCHVESRLTGPSLAIFSFAYFHRPRFCGI